MRGFEEPRAELVIKNGEYTCYASPERNKTADEFVKLLNPLTVTVAVDGGAVVSGSFPFELPGTCTTKEFIAGDIVYRGGNILFLFENTKLCGTKIAHFYEGRAKEFYEAVKRDPLLELSLEWSE